MHQRVYQHPSVKAYTFHLSRYMERFYKRGGYLNDLSGYLSVTDHEILTSIRKEKEDLDAAALLKRASRFSVIEVEKEVGARLLKALQDKALIPAGSLFLISKEAKSQEFPFPVQLRSGRVVPAHLYSQVKIPWVREESLFVERSYLSLVEEELACL